MLIQPTNWTSSDWDTPENAFDLDMSTLASALYRANFGEGGDGLSYLYANYTAKPDSSIFLAYHFGNECGDCNISLWIWNYDDTDWSMLGYLDSPFDSSVHNATFPLEVNDTFAQDGEYDIMLVGHSYVEIGGLEYMTTVNELELFVPPATWFVLTFNYASVSFGALSAGSADNPAPNQLEGAYNATVNTTDAYYKIEASGSDFTDESETFAFGIDMLKMGMNETAAQLDAGDSVALGADPQVIETDIPSTTTDTFHGFWLSVPAAQYATHYTATVTITYSAV
jgi:hypothetical protein